MEDKSDNEIRKSDVFVVSPVNQILNVFMKTNIQAKQRAQSNKKKSEKNI